MKRSFLLFAILTLLTVTSCASKSADTQVTGTPEPIPSEYAGLTNPLGAEAAPEGAKIFKGYCESCHGPQGHGDGPAGAALNPKPKNLAEFAPTVGDDYLFWRVSAGVPGSSMVGWKGILKDEQIWQVITFIRALK